MTENRARKRAIRERMAASGEPYSVAARHLDTPTAHTASSWPRVISVESGHTAGVGRTTVAVGLALQLHKLGRRVLLVDLDPSGHATVATLGTLEPASPTLAEALAAQSPPAAAELVHVGAQGLEVIPAWGIERLPMNAALPPRRLGKLLAALDPSVTDVVIDCPPDNFESIRQVPAALAGRGADSGVLMVMLPDPVSVRAAAETFGPAAAVLGLIVNQTRPSAINASLHDLPRHLGWPVLARIPHGDGLAGAVNAPAGEALGPLAELLIRDPTLRGPRRHLQQLVVGAAQRDAELARLLMVEAPRWALDDPDVDPEFDLGRVLLEDQDAAARIDALIDAILNDVGDAATEAEVEARLTRAAAADRAAGPSDDEALAAFQAIRADDSYGVGPWPEPSEVRPDEDQEEDPPEGYDDVGRPI